MMVYYLVDLLLDAFKTGQMELNHLLGSSSILVKDTKSITSSNVIETSISQKKGSSPVKSLPHSLDQKSTDKVLVKRKVNHKKPKAKISKKTAASAPAQSAYDKALKAIQVKGKKAGSELARKSLKMTSISDLEKSARRGIKKDMSPDESNRLIDAYVESYSNAFAVISAGKTMKDLAKYQGEIKGRRLSQSKKPLIPEDDVLSAVFYKNNDIEEGNKEKYASELQVFLSSVKNAFNEKIKTAGPLKIAKNTGLKNGYQRGLKLCILPEKDALIQNYFKNQKIFEEEEKAEKMPLAIVYANSFCEGFARSSEGRTLLERAQKMGSDHGDQLARKFMDIQDYEGLIDFFDKTVVLNLSVEEQAKLEKAFAISAIEAYDKVLDTVPPEESAKRRAQAIGARARKYGYKEKTREQLISKYKEMKLSASLAVHEIEKCANIFADVYLQECKTDGSVASLINQASARGDRNGSSAIDQSFPRKSSSDLISFYLNNHIDEEISQKDAERIASAYSSGYLARYDSLTQLGESNN